MNDTTVRQLMAFVERSVRTVPASKSCKRRMREELLDHLTDIYEQELEQLGNEQAALKRAEQRFGEPGILTKELRGSVSRWDFFRRLRDLPRWNPEKPRLYLVLTHLALIAFIAFGPVLLFGLWAGWLRGKVDPIGVHLHVICVPFFFTAVLSITSEYFAGKFVRILFGHGSRGSENSLARVCLASLSVFPVMFFFIYWGSFGSLTSGLWGLLFGCLLAPAVPLLSFREAYRRRDEFEYESQWSDIQVED